ncbi:MAG: long-chain fatty acid--CoA ligase [Spirochaetes bacterium]|jgi:long-chain acyl-CoA synthetase|nr:long-chain fatty acid--CoA ligase [Spirochaetota bacterium]
MGKKHLGDMIRESAQKYGDKTAMRFKYGGQMQETSYKKMEVMVRDAALSLLELDAKEGEMIGIFSGNRPEWSISDLAILTIRGVSVPIYATNTAKQAEYIVKDSGIKIIFVGTKDHYDKVQTFINKIDRIIVFDESIPISGDKAMRFTEFLKIGMQSKKEKELEERMSKSSSDDLATLIYTSGTTGDPKGVMLTHSNIFHQIDGIMEHFVITPEDRSLSFLPLSHAYERSWSYIVFYNGVQNNYISDTKKVLEYMQDVKPTCMVSVPRLYEKIYATVYDRLERASGLKKILFNWSVKTGRKYQFKKKDRKFIGPYLAFRHYMADGLVLKKLRDIVGGHKNFFSAGGAPLSIEIEEFFLSIGLLVCQGYGLTETSPVISCNRPGDFKFGTVGKILRDTEVKIADTGEILIRGGNLMKGYYNKPEATSESIVDGWFHTGDVGVIDQDGFLKITDRIKDLIITSQGKNIAPQHIETMVGKDYFIEQIATIGDKRKYISALIVPSFQALEEWARENGISYSSREDLIKNPGVIEMYRKRIDDQSKELANYEKIKKFTLLADEFTQDNGELTPTMKIKRKVVGEKYKDIINSMYTGDGGRDSD